MKITNMKLKTLTIAILALALPAFADKDDHDDHKHCRTNTVNRTNVVTITNRINQVVCQTNVVTVTIHQTNVMTQTVTNYIASSLVDLPITSYPVVANHVYKLLVTSDTTGAWKTWGKIKATDTETIRLILPLDLVKNIYWQLVDTTPGYPQTGVPPVEDDQMTHTTYLALTRGTVKKVPANLPTN